MGEPSVRQPPGEMYPKEDYCERRERQDEVWREGVLGWISSLCADLQSRRLVEHGGEWEHFSEIATTYTGVVLVLCLLAMIPR